MRISRILLVVSLAVLFCFGTAGWGAASTWREQNLTQEEIRFLDSHPVLTAGVGTAFPPIMYVDQEGDKLVFNGMVTDYLELLEDRLQVTIQPKLDISFKQALQMGRDKDIDIFPCIANTQERRKYLRFSEPYLSYPLVVIAKEGSQFISNMEDLVPLRIAIVEPLSVYSKLKHQYPSIKFNFVFKKTVPDVLKAVSLGEADVCISNLAVAIYEINRQGLSNLRVAAPTPWKSNELGMAVRKDFPILLTILEKVLASISIQEHKDISSRWINVQIPEPFEYYGVLKWIGGLAAISFLIFFVAILWIRSLKKEITRRSIIANQLRESEASLLLAAQGNGLQLWDWDLQSDTIEFKTPIDDSSKVFTDYRANWLKDIHPDNEKLASQQLDQCLNGTSNSLELEYKKIGLDGVTKWEHMAGIVYAPTEESPRRMLGYFRDITVSKRMLKRNALSDKLESIGRLASGMAHEMNTPLHYIKGNLNFVGETLERHSRPSAAKTVSTTLGGTPPLPREQKVSNECLDAISESIEGIDRVTKIINALKLFAHVNESSIKEYDLKEVVDKALTITENEWKYCARAVVDIEGNPIVFCNPGDIIQLLTILIINSSQAICSRYKEKSQGLIEIQGQTEDDRLIITVWDNGCGVDEQSKHQIFDPFFTTKEVGEGAGQGLYVAFNIVKKYNGTIACNNNDAGGTTFTMSLPILTGRKQV